MTAIASPMAVASAPVASPHARYIQRCNALFTQPHHALTAQDVELLKRQGNTADDWSRVRKLDARAAVTASRIRDCDFQGVVVLGAFDRDVSYGNVRLRSGVYRSTLRDAVVMDNALVRDTTALSGVFVDSFACIIRCGSVTSGGAADGEWLRFANGMKVHVGVEVGGRDVRVLAEMPFDLAAVIATKRKDTKLLAQHERLVARTVESAKSQCAIVAGHACVADCATIEASFIGAYASVQDSEVVGTTLLSSQRERTVVKSKSIVRHSIVQWNSTVEDLAFVDGSLLCDTSHVDRHGIVLSSIIGPNTSVAEGEITSSLVGPFVGFHHQALLIASVWPEGKGNVGYGANVGSNHTLKAPDQELLPGEGVFFGLGCCIKFPSNFQRAQYAVVATGVATLPQRVEMPFALINSPGHNIRVLSPAINEISPAWVLKHSVFTVLRNEWKFATRNQSKRTKVDAAILRPEIVQGMIDARSQLVAAAGKATIRLADSDEAIYTDKQVAGLGKNYMREAARLEAIDAYSFFIQVFALEGLLAWLEKDGPQGVLPVSLRDLPRGTFLLDLIAQEFPGDLRVPDALQDLVLRRRRIEQDAIKGKKRDDARGQRIIDDYAFVHSPVEQEGAVQYAQRLTADIQQRVARFVARL